MHKDCLICERISLIKKGQNKYFVIELETGYVVLGDFQYYKGYSLLLCKKHTNELHKLPEKFKMKFLKEMSLLAKAVYNAFNPKKINYELLGNTDSHLHWHIFPRHKNDPDKKRSTWVVDKTIRYSQNAKPSDSEIKKLKNKLFIEISKLKEVPHKVH